MTIKHTPGPWGIEIAADGMNKWVGCPRYSVATVAQLPNQVNLGEADANAFLIAAAPDLLEALNYLQSSPNDPRAHRAALSAIAKAKGGAA